MGSDMSMAASYFRPRQSLAWKNRAGRWVIYTDHFVSGYVASRDTHLDTPEVRRLLRSMNVKIVKEKP